MVVRADAAIARLDQFAIVACGVIVVLTLIVERPLPGVAFLLIAGIPLLIAGQVRAIAIRLRRVGLRFGRWGLPEGRQSRALTVCALVAIATSFPLLLQGLAAHNQGGCTWALDDHAVFTCISKAHYERTAAAENRLVAGVFMAFYLLHYDALTGGAERRRRDDSRDRFAGRA